VFSIGIELINHYLLRKLIRPVEIIANQHE